VSVSVEKCGTVNRSALKKSSFFNLNRNQKVVLKSLEIALGGVLSIDNQGGISGLASTKGYRQGDFLDCVQKRCF
jgi:hypothetical protein